MAIKISKTYATGYSVEVEGEKWTDALKELSVAEELFRDNTCAAQVNGQNAKSNNVVFVYRKQGEYDYFEQYCLGGGENDSGNSLRGFKRRIGEANDKSGRVFVRRHTKPEDLNQNEVPGYAGWVKYVNPNAGNYPQQNAAPAPQAPQQSQAAPPPGYSQQQLPSDDIPF